MLLVRNIFNINLTKTNQTDFRGGGGKDFFFLSSLGQSVIRPNLKEGECNYP